MLEFQIPLTRIMHQTSKILVAQAFQPVQKTRYFFGFPYFHQRFNGLPHIFKTS